MSVKISFLFVVQLDQNEALPVCRCTPLRTPAILALPAKSLRSYRSVGCSLLQVHAALGEGHLSWHVLVTLTQGYLIPVYDLEKVRFAFDLDPDLDL